MSSVESEDGGLEEFAQEVLAEAMKDAEKAVTLAAVHLESAVKRKLDGTRSGRMYRVPGTKVAHQASAPGQPPAKMFGELQRAIDRSPTEVSGLEVSAKVGVSERHDARKKARMLEYGGIIHHPNGAVIRIAFRPFLRPTFREEEGKVDDILRRAMP